MLDNKISVIVPVYNSEKYLYECLESIAKQTYKNIEIIVVNDGSTDNSKVVIQEFLNIYENVRLIDKSNQGVTLARLEGVKVSSGNFIGFVDSDDTVEPDMFEILIKNSLKYNADISHCGYNMVFPDGRINEFYNTGEIIIQDKIKGISDLIKGEIIEPGLCNKVYKRNLFNDLKIDSSIKINEDLLMNYYLFKKSDNSVFEDVSKYNYIIRQNSASRCNLNSNKIFDPIRVKKIILDDCEFKEIKEIIKCSYIGTNINVYNSIILDRSKGFEEEKYNIRENIINEKYYFIYLNKRYRILANMILRMPILYTYVYKIYEKYFQNKKYS